MVKKAIFEKRNVLVTGGAGFIGSHVAKALLKRGDEVVIIDNFNSYYDPKLKEDRVKILLGPYNPKIYRVDITDKKALRKVFEENKFDKVCHLAAQAGVRYSMVNPDSYIQSNIVGTHNILEMIREFEIKDLVFASSSSVYGRQEKMPWSESDKVDETINVYAATKKANEEEVYAYHHLYGINAFGLRFFTVYGPWGRPDMAYYMFADKISKGETIDVYNNGKMQRDFTYIDDIVKGVLSALDKVKGYEIINLGNHQPEELEKFIFLIEKYLGKQANKNYLPLQSADFLVNYADNTKAKKILNFESKIDLEEGITRYIQWKKINKKM